MGDLTRTSTKEIWAVLDNPKTYVHERVDGMTMTQLRNTITDSRDMGYFIKEGRAIIVNGATVSVLAESEDWAYVETTEGDEGYVQKKHLKQDAPASPWRPFSAKNRFIELKDVDDVLTILSHKPWTLGDVEVTDVILLLVVLVARMSKPIANGVALGGRSDYPFVASTAQCVGLLCTALLFLVASAWQPEFRMKKTSADKLQMRNSFLVGLMAGLGDVCEMLANQYAGVGLATVLLAASRVVITAVMSKVCIPGKQIPELQAWGLLLVMLSITAFGIATSQAATVPFYRFSLGIGFVLAAGFFLSSQSVMKELLAKPVQSLTQNEPPSTNFYENMIFLFVGASSSSFLLAIFDMHGNLADFFNGWELRSISVPMSVFVMATLSTMFTKHFGALTTVLLSIFSVVLVFFACVLFFGQAQSPLAVVLLVLVAVSVMVASRAEKISKDEEKRRKELEDRFNSLRPCPAGTSARQLSEPLLP